MSTEVMVRGDANQAFAPREEMEARLQLKRELGAMARAFRAATWGKDLDDHTARALAEWCKRHGIDATEVSVLGGNPYIEASYYRRKLTELGSDVLEYAFADHVHHDVRLVDAMNEPIPADADEETKALILANRRQARLEHYRRIGQRVAFNLPDEAPAAVVYRCKRRGMDQEFTGADWCGGKGTRTMKKRDGGTYEKEIDPVGDLEPRKTAETRAMRRCLMQVVSTFPDLSKQIEAMDHEAKTQIAPAIERTQLAIAAQVPRGTPQIVSDDTIPLAENATLVPSPGQAAAPTEPEVHPSEEEFRNAGPVVKAQRWQLEQLLKDGSWTEEEKATALAVADQSNYGELARFLAEMRLELVSRQRDEGRPPTENQRALFLKLMQSHHWSEDEKAEATVFLETATFTTIGRRIDRMHEELRERRHAESAEKRRIKEANDAAA